MKSVKKLLGEKIRKLRKEKGLTQEQLAELVGVEPRHISRVEGGYSSPSVERLAVMANVLEVPIKELFNFMQLSDSEIRLRELETSIKGMSEEYQKIVFKIVRAMEQ